MKNFKRIVAFVALIVAVVCLFLIVTAYTPFNPTRRRYSSEIPLTTGQANSQAIGSDAERILAQDLNIPHNETPGERACICLSSRHPSGCRTCFAYLPSLPTNYRIPDFVTEAFIAESKNEQGLLYTRNDRATQIDDYVLAAIVSDRPLWLYVRVNTQLDPEFYRLVESTGGHVVHYFAVPGWQDPVNWAALAGLILAGLILLGTARMNVSLRIGFTRRPRPKLPKRKPRRKDALGKAVQSVQDVDEFRQRSKESSRRKSDIEDARDDFDDEKNQ